MESEIIKILNRWARETGNHETLEEILKFVVKELKQKISEKVVDLPIIDQDSHG